MYITNSGLPVTHTQLVKELLLKKWFQLKDNLAQALHVTQKFEETDNCDSVYATIDFMPAPVLLLNKSGAIEYANKLAEKILSYSAGSLRGRDASEVIVKKRALVRLDGQLAIDNSQHLFLATCLDGQGKSIELELSENKQVFCGQEKTLLALHESMQGEAANSASRELISALAHEIKTPISSMQGILSLLDSGVTGELSPYGKDMNKQLHSTCKRLSQFVDGLLDLEKIRQGKFLLDKQILRVERVVEAAIDLVSPLAESKNISIAFHGGMNMRWIADEMRVRQVIVNLLSNAIAYADRGSTITIKCERVNFNLRLSVSNRGKEIPAEKLNQLFEKFEQVSIADAKERNGCGLGLALCRAIINAHGGTIGFDCGKSGTTTVWFVLQAKHDLAIKHYHTHKPARRHVSVLRTPVQPILIFDI
jgi:signal transduction histidine kinase